MKVRIVACVHVTKIGGRALVILSYPLRCSFIVLAVPDGQTKAWMQWQS